MIELLWLLAGVVLGGVGAWFIAKYKFASESVDSASLQIEQERVQNLQKENSELKENLEKQRQEVIQLTTSLSSTEADYRNLQEKLRDQKQELEKLQERFSIEFKNLANEIFEEKSKKFTDQNKTNIGELLNPLKEKISDFEKKVEINSKQSIEQSASLKEQLNNLKELNRQMTKEAESLTKALKGDSKAQGNWGEMQLESILEKVGLQKGIHYEKEQNYKNEEGSNQRLDYIIKLPEDKYLVLDSKVSLTAYSNYHEAEDETQKAVYLKRHVDSVSNHIKTLSDKSYEKIHDINQPDYILMFVANEPALTIACQEQPNLFENALNRNIVLVSTSTLLATMRTISYIWKQDLQNKNAIEIATQAGSLYDKFKNFTDDLIKVGRQLGQTQSTYQDAMKKLSEGKDNLVRKTERLKELGAKASKSIEQKLIDRSE